MGGSIAVALGAPLGALVAELYGWRVAYVGLGLMGTEMTLRLLERGWQVTVWNLEPERVPPLVAAGATAAASPAEVARASDIVLMCVLHTAAVEACVFGSGGISSLGAVEIPRREYLRDLAAAVRLDVDPFA